MPKRIGRSFFTRPTLKVAKELLGKFIVRKYRDKKIIGKIVETEAYIGPQDKASHGYQMKKTKRNRAEYLIGGHIYIYLVYGMYYQLNISTEKEGLPRCVLIRALEPIDGISQIIKNKYNNRNLRVFAFRSAKIRNLTNGPGKLCRYLKLDKSFYAEDLTKSKRIWLEDRGIKIKKSEIVASKRIGIDYAGKYWANKKWRFYLKDNPFVSQK